MRATRRRAAVILISLVAVAPSILGNGPARADEPESFLRVEGAPGAGRHVRQVPRAGQGQRRPAARLARGDAQGAAKAGRPSCPGDPNESLLIQAVEHEDKSLEMPPGKLLPRGVREDLAAWIAAGAKWPKSRDGGPDRSRGGSTGRSSRSVTISPPDDPTGWATGPIDRFIAAGQRAHGLHARPAGRQADLDPPGHVRPDRAAARRRSESRRSSPTSGPMPTSAWSTSCWPRLTTASAGAGTGSTWPAMPTPPAITPTTRSPRPTSIATT